MKQEPLDWNCPHGKKWGIGCRESECFNFGHDGSYEAQSARVSTGRRVPKKPACP